MAIAAILSALIVATLVLFVIKQPARDDVVTGIMFTDRKTGQWFVCLSNRVMPLKFDTEDDARKFLEANETGKVK